MRRLAAPLVAAAIVASLPGAAFAAETSAIPPVVLQGCAAKVKPGSASLFASQSALGGSAVGARTVGFDISFVNTSDKVAKLVLIRIGATEFADIGTFSPNAVIAWRVAAKEGSDCVIKAVRFVDGSEWSLPAAGDAPAGGSTMPRPTPP
jgi:hypothetical protein